MPSNSQTAKLLSMTDYEGNGVFSTMRQADIEPGNADFFTPLKGTPMKYNCRSAIPISKNLDISPIRTSGAGSKCFHHSFLGGEASSQTGNIVMGFQLCSRINAVEERIFPPRYGAVDAPYLDDINPT